MRIHLHSTAILAALLAACGSRSRSVGQETTASAQLPSQGDPATPDCGGATNDWPMFGQNLCSTRSVEGPGAVDRSSVSKLAVKWTFQAAGDISATPAVVGNDVFVPDWGGMLNKVDARTGRADWSISIAGLLGLGDAGAGANDTPAAVVSRDTPIVTDDTVIFGVCHGASVALGDLAVVVAVDRQTGALKWQTTVDPHPAALITSSPVFDGGRVYVGVSSGEEFATALPVFAGIPYSCCSFRGSVVALDAATGSVVWKTYTIEDNAYFQSDGQTPSGFAGGAVWSAPTVDRVRQSLYVTTGNNYSAPPGTTSLPAGDHVESILSLDLGTGAIRWAQRMTMGDTWNLLDLLEGAPAGPDWDFGSSASLFRVRVKGTFKSVLGAGQKSGMYWEVDPDTGNVIWNTAVGPGGHLGGIHWGAAVDDDRVYVGVNDELGTSYSLGGAGADGGQSTVVGSWAALDPVTGNIEWQVANPTMTAEIGGASVNGPVTAVNGVLFGGSMDTQGTMFAFDGATGAILWSFPSGATVYGGPAVAQGVVYWGNGYPNGRLRFGTPGGTLYAFAVAK